MNKPANSKSAETSDKQVRLAKALRDNLKRRKQQAKNRAGTGPKIKD